jgi:hypothetical protein
MTGGQHAVARVASQTRRSERHRWLGKMNGKRTSKWLMVLALSFLLFSPVASVPPRRLMSYHVQQFALIPLCAFLAALPGVPTRWFAYFSALAVAPMIDKFSYQIEGTSFRLGWNQGICRFLLPVLIIMAVVISSVVAAWLRVGLQTAIARRSRNANNTAHDNLAPRRGSPS